MIDLVNNNVFGLFLLCAVRLIVGACLMFNERLIKIEIFQISFIAVCVASMFISTECFLFPAMAMIIREISLFIKSSKMKTVNVN